MTNTLLIIITIMVLITMICSVITTMLVAKNSKEKDLVNKMLKVAGWIITVVIIIIAAVSASFIKNEENNENSIKSVSLEEAGFNEITINEYLELIKKPEKNVILVARPTCGFCEQFTPVLKQASEDMNITVNYIDTDKFSADDWATFNETFEFLGGEWGTPLVMITENGNLVAENQGYVELETIKKFFTDNGLGE